MTIVVVEGVDGAGKTTLINNLRDVSREYFWVLRASGPANSSDQLQRAVDELSTLIDGSPTNWVFDRHPLVSEPIYGHILRGKSHLEGMSAWGYKARIQEFSKIIYCRPPFDIVQEESKHERQLEGVHDKLRGLYDAYDEAMDFLRVHLRVPVITYDWTAGKLTQAYKGTTCDINQLFWERVV